MKRHSHNPVSDAEALAHRLRAESRKITGPRRALLQLLAAEKHPVSIRELHRLMRNTSCDLATIYRSLKMLERLGIVKRFDFGDGVARYELQRDHDGGHHHHLICTGCAKVVEIQDCFPSELEKRIASGNGFTRISHKLEFFGICPECQIQ
jgi:Fur family ferric uptake transcriptional regulator